MISRIHEQKNFIKYKMSPVKDKWTYDEFLYYRMQDMSSKEQREIMTVDELWAEEARLNDDRFRDIFNNKKKFYQVFKKYMKREIGFLEDMSLEEFEGFLKRHRKVILKPVDMYAGMGASVVFSELIYEGNNTIELSQKEKIQKEINSSTRNEIGLQNEELKEKSQKEINNRFQNIDASQVETAKENLQKEMNNRSKNIDEPQVETAKEKLQKAINDKMKNEQEIEFLKKVASEKDAFYAMESSDETENQEITEKEAFYQNFLPKYMSATQAISLFPELVKNNYVIEEFVQQHLAYNTIYSGCLNTIRVNTIVNADGTAKVFSAVNQFGCNGTVTDNDDEDGFWAAIDIDTGKVFAVEIDVDNNYVYDLHPNTKESIRDFCNPKFDEVKDLACKAALEIPECRLIGWDICLTEDDEIEIIEGNVTPELDLIQAITKKGFRSLFAT